MKKLLKTITFVTCLCILLTIPAFAASIGKPTVKSVTSPGTGSITVQYSKVNKAKGYQVDFATNSNFSSGRKTYTTSSTTYKKSGLTANKKYYVRVRAYKTSGRKKTYGPWSSVKNVTTQKATINLTRDQWLASVDDWCNYMLKDGNWIYSNSKNKADYKEAIKSSHRSNCALMISHALQRAGIISRGNSFYSDANGNAKGTAAWNELCKYATVINVNKKTATQLDLQPGDIVMWDSHMNIYIGKDNAGNLMWYDGSSLMTVDQKHGSLFKSFRRTNNDIPVPKTGKPHVAYKIVRLNYKN